MDQVETTNGAGHPGLLPVVAEVIYLDLHGYLRLDDHLRLAPAETLRHALAELLAPTLGATFAAGRTADHELAALQALQTLGVLPENPSEYDLVMRLRVTRAKARALLYRLRLAALEGVEELDDRVRDVVARPTVERVGSSTSGRVEWVLDVPDPLVTDRIRQLAREAGFVTDGSFSPSLVKLSLRAYAKLVERLIPQQRRDAVWAQARRRAEWANRRDLQDVLEAAAVQLLTAGAGVVGEELGRDLMGLLKQGATALFDRVRRMSES